MRTNTKKTVHRTRRSKPVVSAPPLGVVDALGTAAANEYAHVVLSSRGSAKAVTTLVGAGVRAPVAIDRVAARAKGLMGELDLSASFSARSGLIGAKALARPNPMSTHPTDDILLTLAGKKAAAVQVKTGNATYVANALDSGQYDRTVLIANAEAVAALEELGVTAKGAIPSRLSFGGVESSPLSATDMRARTVDALTKVMSGAPYHDRVEPLLVGIKAGATDGIQTLGLNLLVDLVEAVATGGTFDFEVAFTRSLKAGAKVALRNGAVTWSQVTTFLRRGKRAFSARLVHRIASSTFAMSAVADVVIDTAFDLVEVHRGRMDWDTLLRNLGVNTLTAAGGVGGAMVGARLARNAPWPIALLAIFGGMWLGSKGGRMAGEWLFDEEVDNGWQPA